MNAKINIFTLVLFGAAASLFGGSSAAECWEGWEVQSDCPCGKIHTADETKEGLTDTVIWEVCPDSRPWAHRTYNERTTGTYTHDNIETREGKGADVKDNNDCPCTSDTQKKCGSSVSWFDNGPN